MTSFTRARLAYIGGSTFPSQIVEALQTPLAGHPLSFDDLAGGGGTWSHRCSGPCPGEPGSLSAPRVSSMSGLGSGAGAPGRGQSSRCPRRRSESSTARIINRQGSSRRWIAGPSRTRRAAWTPTAFDLYQVHRPRTHTRSRRPADLVHQGKVRYIGGSTFPASQIVEAQWVAASGSSALRHQQPATPCWCAASRTIRQPARRRRPTVR